MKEKETSGVLPQVFIVNRAYRLRLLQGFKHEIQFERLVSRQCSEIEYERYEDHLLLILKTHHG